MSVEGGDSAREAMELGPGALVLVVGPSGAGKDALINGARTALAGDTRFIFADRIVTRPPHAAEGHGSMTDAAFQEAQQGGAFALTWKAHGLCYGVLTAIDHDIADGRIVIVNGSRTIAGSARHRYARTALIHVDCPVEIRATRIAARGRESAGEVAARLNRDVTAFDPNDADVRIDNAGALEDGIKILADALTSFARAP